MSKQCSPDSNQDDSLNKARFSKLIEYRPLITLLKVKLPTLLAMYAFGSQVKGNANNKSDLDLAVLVAGYIEPFELWDLSGQLADIAGCQVDLVDMRSASTVMQYQIVQTGMILWAKQPDAGVFEGFVLSEKIALDTARAGVLKDINQSGKVYAS